MNKYRENMTPAELDQLLAEEAELDAAYAAAFERDEARAAEGLDDLDADDECEADQYHYWRP